MIADDDVRKEIRLLRERAPEICGSIACSVDGLPIAFDIEDGVDRGQVDRTAALSSALLAMSSHMIEMTGGGAYRETLVSGARGYTACYAAGPTIVLTVLARPDANLGLLRLEGRKTAENLAAIATRASDDTHQTED